jgi:hypothetical protein
MKSQTEEQKTTETKKPRFKIEKLEERIAPAKGGIPGPPDGGYCKYVYQRGHRSYKAVGPGC